MMAKEKDMIAKAQEGLANGTVSQQEAIDALLEATKMRQVVEERTKQKYALLFR